MVMGAVSDFAAAYTTGPAVAGVAAAPRCRLIRDHKPFGEPTRSRRKPADHVRPSAGPRREPAPRPRSRRR